MLTASAFAGGPLESNSLIFVSCQLFTSVFGVGPKTAEKWYRAGLRSLDQILADQNIHLNHMQQNGASVSINTHTHTHTTTHTQSCTERCGLAGLNVERRKVAAPQSSMRPLLTKCYPDNSSTTGHCTRCSDNYIECICFC